jgi:DGQHR domain-containing protein
MKNRRYFGYYIRQREDKNTVCFFVFLARVRDLKEWVGIRRIQNSSEGIQRILRPTRQKAITRFIRSTSINTIPNSILIAFEEGIAKFESLKSKFSESFSESEAKALYNKCDDNQLDLGFLEFSFDPNRPEESRPILIIDGQHRFYGIADYEDEDLPLLVVSLVDSTPQEQAFQFIVINNKAVRVPTESVKSIIANFNEAELTQRLLKAGVSYGKHSPVLIDINDLPTSPFQHLLDWPYNQQGEKLVAITAIEQSLRYLKAQFDFLDKDDDTDTLVEIFCAIWRSIKINYSELWSAGNKFMTKVNVNAINEFAAAQLKFAWTLTGYNLVDLYDPSSVERLISNIINPKIMPLDFWQSDWSIKIQDTAGVRKLIKEDLEQMSNNYKLRRPWYEDLELPMNSEMTSEYE